MATLPSIDQAVYSKLSAAASLASLVSTRIAESQAPSGWALPYIIFYQASQVLPNDTPRDDINTVYRVEAVAGTRAAAEALHQAIYAVMHNESLTITGWSNYWTRCIGVIKPPVENVEGKQYHRRVGEYRIRAARD